MTALYLFRHGETDWNAEGRIQGSTDIELNALGRKQAEGLALLTQGRGITAVITSDLKRAYETGRIVAAGLEVPLTTDPRLREIMLGDAEGLLASDIDTRFGKEAMGHWQSTYLDQVDFAFPNGETKAAAIARARAAIAAAMRAHPGKVLAFSTHGGLIRNLAHSCLPDHADRVRTPNCSLHLFRADPELTYEGVIV
jgi:probable phosphoglycerate mutase